MLRDSIDIRSESVSVDDIQTGDIILADIGSSYVDVRTGKVMSVDDDRERVKMSLPGIRLDGPYIVPISHVRSVVS